MGWISNHHFSNCLGSFKHRPYRVEQLIALQTTHYVLFFFPFLDFPPRCLSLPKPHQLLCSTYSTPQGKIHCGYRARNSQRGLKRWNSLVECALYFPSYNISSFFSSSSPHGFTEVSQEITPMPNTIHNSLPPPKKVREGNLCRGFLRRGILNVAILWENFSQAQPIDE